jgi:hypothetical protein
VARVSTAKGSKSLLVGPTMSAQKGLPRSTLHAHPTAFGYSLDTPNHLLREIGIEVGSFLNAETIRRHLVTVGPLVGRAETKTFEVFVCISESKTHNDDT